MSTTSVGPAAPGFPLSGAAMQGDDLILVGRNLDPLRIAVIDTRTWTLTRTVTHQPGDGAFATATAADGVYLGMYGTAGQANVLRLTDSGLQPRALLAPQLPWDLAADSQPTVVGVATNPSLVFTIDRQTGAARDIGVVTPGARPRTVALVGGRIIVGGSASGSAWLRVADRDGTGAADVLPAALRDDSIVYCSVALSGGRVAVGTGGAGLRTPAVAVVDPDRPHAAMVVRLPRESLVDTVAVAGTTVFATARPSGALYRIDTSSGALHRLAVPVPMSETREIVVRGRSVIGASADGSAWTYDRDTDVVVRRDPEALGLVPRPQRAQSILATAEHVDVGGSFSITRHDLATSSSTTRFVPGEPKAMVAVDGRTHFALYPVAELWAWPPGDAEPVRLGRLPGDQLRPIDLAHVPQLDALVVSTTDDHAHSGLHTVDPVTGRVDSMFDPLGLGQTASGLCVEGTTCYVGGSGPDPAVGAVDLLTGRLRWSVPAVAPNGSFVLSLLLVDGALLASTVTGWVVRIDPASRQVVRRRQVAPAAGRMRLAGGDVLLATGDQLLRVDPVSLGTSVVEGGLDGQVWGWPPLSVDPAGRAWLIAGRDLVHT